MNLVSPSHASMPENKAAQRHYHTLTYDHADDLGGRAPSVMRMPIRCVLCDAVSSHTINADHSQQQRRRCESAEQEQIKPAWSNGIRKHLLQSQNLEESLGLVDFRNKLT